MFSSRASLDLTPNRQSALLAELLGRGIPIIDLTLSNPTEAGFVYPDSLFVPLGDPASLRYEPSPFGMASARDAISGDYARRGITVPAERIVLTASTSEAYSLIFKLLCDPGDAVIVPVPSYPLFEHLARLDAVQLASYPLEYHGRWSIDVEALVRSLTSRTRAVLVVSPNNPTGSFLSRKQLDSLADVCSKHDLALVGDEVFADYAFDRGSIWPSVVDQDRALAFGLGGLSKSAGLPQAKLGWIGVGGPATTVTACLARLELICDTYLSVSTPVQRAVGALLEQGTHVREQIRARTVANRQALAQLVSRASAIDLLDADGGWYAVLRVPATRTEEQLALELLRDDHVLVHPGYFFDFPHEAFLVVSLLTPPDDFTAGIRRVIARATVS